MTFEFDARRLDWRGKECVPRARYALGAIYVVWLDLDMVFLDIPLSSRGVR
jgi:hypothetical protein